MGLTSPRDGDGHGDTFSAFALALIIAHELAGKRPIVVGSFGGDRSYADSFAARQREYDAEQQALAQDDDDPSGLLDAIRDGGVQVFCHGNPFG